VRRKVLRTAVRTAGGIALAVTVAVVALLALAFGPTMIGFESMVVTTGSMGSAAPPGSVVLTRMVDARAVGVGDIVSYRRQGRQVPVTHRVSSVQREGGKVVLQTKGDANPTPDIEPVVIQGPIARVEHVVPYAGYVVKFARTPLGGLAFFVLPMFGLTMDRGRRRARRVEEMQDARSEWRPVAGAAVRHAQLHGRRSWAAQSTSHRPPANEPRPGLLIPDRGSWNGSFRSA